MSTTTTPVDRPTVAPRPRLQRAGLARALVFWVAGAAPVGAIPLHVLGVMPIDESARVIVLPLAVAAAVLAMTSTHEAAWARRGAVAGLVAVFAYDALRLPMVWLHIWPDFIPALGGWVTGSDHPNPFIGYTWRYFGDGAGIAMAYFTVCGAVRLIRPGLVGAKPVALSIGYGIFIWFGLIATVVFTPTGGVILFHLTAMSFVLSLAGHLIYGSVLGLVLGHFTVAGAGATWFSGHHLGARSFAAAKGWTAAHVPLTAIGGLAVTATAVAAVYGTAQLHGHASNHLGSPAQQRHQLVAGGSAPDPQRQLRPHHSPSPAQSPVVRPAVALAPSPQPTASPTPSSTASPSSEPTLEPTSTPTPSPTSDPTSTPTITPPTRVSFTSNPPSDPKFGDTYQVSASGGSGPVVFSIDPSTTNAGTSYVACSIDETTVTFDHAGTCVISAGSTTGQATLPTEDATQSVLVRRETASITFDPGLPADAKVGDSYPFTVTGAPSGEPVQVVTADSQVCAVSGAKISFVSAGSCVITATQKQSVDYEGVAFSGTVTVAPSMADLGVSATPSDPDTGSALAGVTATVSGLPEGSSAVLTATANGALDFRPDGAARDACTLQTSGADATVWTCLVRREGQQLGFAIDTAHGRDVSFSIAPLPPLTDPNPDNDVARVHWDPDPKPSAAGSSEPALSSALGRRDSTHRRRAARSA